MAGGFIAFRCSNYDNTAEREQFRYLCNILKEKYRKSDELCLLIANYNIYDSEFDSIMIKNDAIIAVEFKNYGGTIVAKENGEWTADGKVIKGGSRKTVYQQARINHAALKNGLRELGINSDWIKDVPSLIVFNQDSEINNQLSGKVQSWLHITDNTHFLEKVEDITCKSTDLSNSDIIDIAIKMNLNSFIDQSLSCYHSGDEPNEDNNKDNDVQASSITEILESYDRRTPNHIFSLRPNQVFVFGTDTKGSQKYGAAGIAAKRFGAQVGVVEGPTGNCYALPTRGFSIEVFSKAVERFLQHVKDNSNQIFLVTPVGCGHAGYDVKKVAELFKDLLTNENVMLPELFLNVYREDIAESSTNITLDEQVSISGEISNVEDRLSGIIRYFEKNNLPFDLNNGFELCDKDGNVIAKAELGIEKQKIVFFPYNSQSEATFRNYGYRIEDPNEFVQSQNR